MPIEWEKWPDVPKGREGMNLYYNVEMDAVQEAALRAKGWNPINTLLMDNDTDGDRAEAIKATYQGVRMGTVALNPTAVKILESEARIYGLTTGKAPKSDVSASLYDEMDVAELLSIGGNTGHQNDKKQLNAPKSKGGRPKGVKDTKKRKPRGKNVKGNERAD